MSELLLRTEKSLGQKIIEKLRANTFCIIGCGAAGSMFAEMLVRSGAKHLILIDGEEFEESNLGGCFTFTRKHVKQNKTQVLKEKLREINYDIDVQVCEEHFRPPICKNGPSESYQFARNAEYIVVAMDNNQARILCEEFCKGENIIRLSISIEVEEKGNGSYEAVWQPQVQREDAGLMGYGEHGSYISIVTEAVATAFNMLLAHFAGVEPRCAKVRREQENFIPIKQVVLRKKLPRAENL